MRKLLEVLTYGVFVLVCLWAMLETVTTRIG